MLPGTGQESRAFAGALAHPGLREAALWSGMDLSERSELSMPDHALSRFPEALDVPGPETSPDFLARSGTCTPAWPPHSTSILLPPPPPVLSFFTTIFLSIRSFNSATWEMIPTIRLPPARPFNTFTA